MTELEKLLDKDNSPETQTILEDTKEFLTKGLFNRLNSKIFSIDQIMLII